MDKIVLINDKGRSYTYEQLNIEQCSFAKLINANCLMFLVCTNTIECIVSYVSCIHNKIPVLLVDKNILPERYDKLVSDFKPDYVYLPKESNFLRNRSENIYENSNYSLLKYSTINEGYSMYEQLALLISTSGSSGSNKHVRISYVNLSHNTYAIAKALNISKDDVAITSLPMNYCYGLSVINTHLYRKATILVTEETIVSNVNKGVINTGDIGYTDEEGYLYIVARKDRVVKINGLRIKLDEIEQLLKDRFG